MFLFCSHAKNTFTNGLAHILSVSRIKKAYQDKMKCIFVILLIRLVRLSLLKKEMSSE